MRTALSFALGAATGAAVAHFIDPDSGRKRRGQLRSVITSQRPEAMDDVTLADRVRSEIFRPADAPKGSVSVDVQAGVAYLRGEVTDPAWIERFAAEARKVTGIDGVKNLLHTPGTPTPAAEPRSLASENFKQN
jgi:hypothetical protein